MLPKPFSDTAAVNFWQKSFGPWGTSSNLEMHCSKVVSLFPISMYSSYQVTTVYYCFLKKKVMIAQAAHDFMD